MPEAFSTFAPTALAKLVQDLLNFVFVSETADDRKTGLQPFLIEDASAEHKQTNLELAHMYGMLQTGEQAVLLSNLEQSIPISSFELKRSPGMFGNLLGTVLSSTTKR